jgi:tetratricopeptide (TPR) repeat protein
MFDDDNDYDDLGFLEELLSKYNALKNGNNIGILDEEEFEQLVEYFFRIGSDTDALEACELARNYYPYSSGILLLKAEILTQEQKYGQALKVLDELESLDANNLDAILLRSDIYVNQQKLDVAAQFLEQKVAHTAPFNQVDLLMELADIYDELEDFDAVFNTLVRVLKIDMRHEDALQKLYFWAEFAGRYEESVELHTAIVQEDPYNAVAWYNLGAAYQGLKLYEKSIDSYGYCLAIDEKFEFAYRNMADAYLRIKQYDKALETLEKHLEIGKPEDVIYEAMGYCYEKKRDFVKARYYYRQASKLNPSDDTIFFRIGETYAREKQWDKAVKAYSTALNLNKDNASYCIAIGNCLMEMDAVNEALVCYVNAVRLKPSSKTTWSSLIKGLYFAEYYDEALTQLSIAMDECGERPDFYYLKAGILMELGRIKEALHQLEEGLHLAPSKVKLFTSLNSDYLNRKDVADIIAKFKKGH